MTDDKLYTGLSANTNTNTIIDWQTLLLYLPLKYVFILEENVSGAVGQTKLTNSLGQTKLTNSLGQTKLTIPLGQTKHTNFFRETTTWTFDPGRTWSGSAPWNHGKFYESAGEKQTISSQYFLVLNWEVKQNT